MLEKERVSESLADTPGSGKPAPSASLSDDCIRRSINDVIEMYPPVLQPGQRADVSRILMHIRLVLDEADPGARVCDLGGGIGLFSPVCAKLGLQATLVDDFGDEINRMYPLHDLGIHAALGVNIVAANALSSDLDFPANHFDCVTSFDSMEHWHKSPKSLFKKIVNWLRPGGLFILGVPNCVNLRKRLTVPFGIGKWSTMQEWYEEETFRGHVREPDVDDLRYIANDMGLINIRLLGRNWLGYHSRFRAVKIAMPWIDKLLQVRPSLCSDLYLIANTKH